ncbi:MAG: MBL fold metallo-hydrolase [Deltaproteobacteria bacterium]|nr:MBL fold metallo-hydrolase [Deltaproteobacteria bacterium]
MIVRQLFDQTSSTYSYLVADGTEAVLIDPVFEQHERDAALITELGLTLTATLDTHCHADHVTGAWRMHERFGSKIGLAAVYGGANIDLPLTGGITVPIGSSSLEVRATPGHTDGCMSFVSADRSCVFTGDALLVRGAGRTDFQAGDARRLFQSIHEQLWPLPDSCIVYPGHDYSGRTSSTIGEERRHNPRIGGGAREEDFVGYMSNLGLPHPKQLAVAVPANLRAGKPERAAPAEPAWGPVIMTYAGHQEIAPEWVATHRNAIHLLDVRSAAELDGELGHLAGIQHIPLDELRARLAEVTTTKPIVVVCQTGKRSAMGTTILRAAGRAETANLAGGMVRWRELGL